MLCKIKLAIGVSGVRRLTLSGGVAANSGLRAALQKMAEKEKCELFLPPVSMCTDNAAMIAAAGFNGYMCGRRSDLSLSPDPSWELW